MSTKSSLTFLFIPVDHWGHINPAIGIGERLVAQGHRAIIALEQSWKGKIPGSYPGLEEALYVDPTRGDSSAKANEHWLANLKARASTFPLEDFEKLKAINQNTEQNAKALYILLNVDDELKRIIAEVKPNLIVVDCFSTVPAVVHSGIPWVRLFSGAPLRFLPSDDLPPPASGLPLNGDRAIWAEYRQLSKSLVIDRLLAFHEKMEKEYQIPKPVDILQTAQYSPYLNIYAYPEELDYLDIRPLPEKFQRFDHFIRLTEKDPDFKIPDEFLNQPKGRLIFVSMGSMGSVDTILMQRLVDILAQSPNRFIFSLGPSYGQLQLASNMWGAKFVPQIDVLQMVDLVITHGGNNTVLESLYFGKPMIVCPLFAEQPENAQRISELKLGHRINAYTCDPQVMLDKIEELLDNDELAKRLAKISEKMQKSKSTEKIALTFVKLATNSV